jgi:hypothetical protein
MVRGTLSQLTHDAMTIGWVVGWVVSGFPPLFIAFLSHRLAYMNTKVKVKNKDEGVTVNELNINKLEKDLNKGFNGKTIDYTDLKKNA